MTSRPEAIKVLACVCRSECNVALRPAAFIAACHWWVTTSGDNGEPSGWSKTKVGLPPIPQAKRSSCCAFLWARRLDHDRGRQGDRAAATAALRILEAQPSPLGLLEVLRDLERAGIEVHVLPGQRQCFAPAQSGAEQHQRDEI